MSAAAGGQTESSRLQGEPLYGSPPRARPGAWTEHGGHPKLRAMSNGVGYQVVHVQCLRCGHRGEVPGERWARARHKYCRECGSRDFDLRWVWQEGKPLNNVIPFDAGKRPRHSQG